MGYWAVLSPKASLQVFVYSAIKQEGSFVSVLIGL